MDGTIAAKGQKSEDRDQRTENAVALPAQVQTVADKLDELLAALRRTWGASSGGRASTRALTSRLSLGSRGRSPSRAQMQAIADKLDEVLTALRWG